MKKTPLRPVIALKRFLLMAFAGLGGLVAQTPPAAAPEEPKPEQPQQLDKFIVTGSYIPSTETAIEAGASPIVRLDRRIIENSGATNTSELLKQITVTNANSVPIANNATGFTPGATAVSLRGLGPEATLVLINGRRVAPYPVGVGGTTAFVDLNSIPLSAIDNIEVLKDGASALYGADAVAGVININLRRTMDGEEVFMSYGNTTNKDSSEFTANFATGATSGKTNMMVALNYYSRAPIMSRDRAYSRVPPFLSENSSPANLEITRFSASAALGQPLTAPIPGVAASEVFFFANSGADASNNGRKPAAQYTYSSDRVSEFNFNEFSMSYPSSTRKGALAFGERKVFGTDNVRAYVDFSYQDVAFENQLAPTPTGDFSAPGHVELVIPARTANPILTLIVPPGFVVQVAAGTPAPRGSFAGPGTQIVNGAAQRRAAPGAANPFNPFNQDITDDSRARLAEFGNRIIRSETDAFMFNAGLKGENVAGRWNFDAALGYSAIGDHSRNTMNSASRFNQMVNANAPIFDPQSPSYIGTTTPYNPFGYYRNPIDSNAALIAYGKVDLNDTNKSTLAQASFVVSTTQLWKLPAGAVGVAVGGDFRHEQLEQHPDALAAAGDLIGEQARASTNAQRKVGGVFLEARVPVLRMLEASASVRHEEFFTSHRNKTVPKVALRFQPFGNQLTLRSSYSEGFREPSLYELYSSPVSGLFPIQDPRDGFIEPEQPITLRGNRRLAAEKTDYYNAGFVWSPTIHRLKGLSVGVDYWKVDREGTVDSSPENTVLRAFGVLPGGLNPGESVLFSTSGFISQVNSVFFNIGRTKAEGWDFSGGYQLPTDSLGRWELTTVWTLLSRFDRASVKDAPLQSVLARDSTGTADDGYLRWKGYVRLNWAFKGFNVHVRGDYTDGFDDLDPNGDPFRVADRFLVFGQVAYSFPGTRGAILRDTKVTVGIRNLFDTDPPKAYGSGGNTNGYPGYLYTPEGRFWEVSVQRKF